MFVYCTASHAPTRVATLSAGSLPALPSVVYASDSLSDVARASAQRKAHYVGLSQRWHYATMREHLPLPASATPLFDPWQAAVLEACRWLRRWRAYDASLAACEPLPASAPLSAEPLAGCHCRHCLSAA
jgi:hypothetical protein